MHRTAVFISTIALLLVVRAPYVVGAGKKMDKPPEASQINLLALNMAARTALATGVEYLLTNIETNFMHFAAPPATTRKLVGWEKQETYQLHYRKVEVPRFENIYEEYETFVVGSTKSVDSRTVGKVKRKRYVGRKQVGTRESLVRDKDGPIVRTHTRNVGPIYDNGIELWQDHMPGDNALALLALLKSGVPETDEQVHELALALNNYVVSYGISDLTWNVAWIAAAFSNLQDDCYKKSRDLAISRILDGQIATGVERGMWGPLCINLGLLPALVQHEADMSANLTAMKADLIQKQRECKASKVEMYTDRVAKLNDYILSLKDLYKPVTQQGLRFDSFAQLFTLKEVEWDPDNRYTAGLPYYFYNQTLADLESTSLALYAIGEAAENGCLIAKTQVPDLSKGPAISLTRKRNASRSASLPEPLQSSAILARSAAAIAQSQKPDGSFDQCNLHQPCHAFEVLGLPPLKEEAIPPALTSIKTEATSAQGYACFLNAGKAVGISKLFRKYGRNVTAARERMLDDAIGYLDRTHKSVIPEGRILAPYDLYFAMLGIHRSIDPTIEDRRDLWSRFAYEILQTQHWTGAWGTPHEAGAWGAPPLKAWTLKDQRLHSSSLWAWKPFGEKVTWESNPGNKGKPFDIKKYWGNVWYGFMSLRWTNVIRNINDIEATNREIVSTCLAMLFIADGVHSPVAGYIDITNKTPPPKILKSVCFWLKQKYHIAATAIKLTPTNIKTAISSVGIVFTVGCDSLADEGIADAIKYHLKDGVLVVGIQSRDEINQIEKMVKPWLNGAPIKELPTTTGFLSEYQGKMPVVRGMYAPDGHIAVIFVPTGNLPSAASFTQVICLLTKNSLGPEFFDPRYPSLYDGSDPFKARVAALADLYNVGGNTKRTVRAAPVNDKNAEASKDGGGANNTSPAKDAVPDDETW